MGVDAEACIPIGTSPDDILLVLSLVSGATPIKRQGKPGDREYHFVCKKVERDKYGVTPDDGNEWYDYQDVIGAARPPSKERIEWAQPFASYEDPEELKGEEIEKSPSFEKEVDR